VAKSKDCWHFSNAATPLLRSTVFLAAPLDFQLRLDHAPQQADEMCHNPGVCRVFKGIPVNDGSGVSSRVYGGREGGVMGSLAAGELSAATRYRWKSRMQRRQRPNSPALFQNPLIWRKAFPAAKAHRFCQGATVMEKSHEAFEPWKDCDCNHDLRVYGPALLRLV
jgi:hypothetical protein